MNVTATSAWRALQQHADSLRDTSLDTLILNDPTRLDECQLTCEGLSLFYAFQKITPETLFLLKNFAAQQDVEDWRERLFTGEKVNTTEKRAALHTALRQPNDVPLYVDGVDLITELRATQKRIASFVDAVRDGTWKGATGKPIRHIVNIGIGGSDLGPRMAALALRPFISNVDVRFVANVDAFDLEQALVGLDPEQTLFVVVSKTFTTQETLLNARSARRWLTGHLGEAAVARHFVAVSTSRNEVEKFGIHADHMFPMWDCIGGRFSLWSAVGLSVQLAMGCEHFHALLAGAAAMDAHFRITPLEKNIPVIMALLGVSNRNFLNMPAQVILPYSERLRELPRYLQQLQMESNGKSVSRTGATLNYETVPALFGECGTVGQHSFHQWLHQGTTPLPADFIGIKADVYAQPEHHRALGANMVAQMGALAFGQPNADAPQDIYRGGRPSSLILLDRLDPYHLGLLLAMYEHVTFVQSVLWEINSFDQPGVELGKRMAKGLEHTDPVTPAQSPAPAFIAAFYKATTK